MPKVKLLKRLGQNFLIDKNVIRKVIREAKLLKSDVVLEIGPGMGALTKELAKLAKQVIAVEKDPRLIEMLKENLKEFKNIKIIHGDILKLDENCSPLKSGEQFSVIANLPFYITAPTIRKFLESENPPKEMILIIQKEVAQRICAKPPRMNLLAVSVQFYAVPKIISYVSKKSFRPQPKVDAAIIKIIPHNKYEELSSSYLFRVVKAGFSQPRKQLANNLSKKLKLKKQDVVGAILVVAQPTCRAENLSINDWIKLSNMLK